MGAPVLMGAGLGAVTSLAMGRDPLQGALLGGVTGGTFGGSGGLGSGFTEGGLFSSAIPDAAVSSGIGSEVASNAITATDDLMLGVGDINPNLAMDTGFGVQIPNESIMSTDQLMSGVGDIQPQLGLNTGFGVDVASASPMNGLNATFPEKSLLEKVQSIPNPFKDMSLLEQTTMAKLGMDAVTPQQQAQGLIDRPTSINAGKPLDVDQTKTGMLNVQVPDSFIDKVKRRQLFTQ